MIEMAPKLQGVIPEILLVVGAVVVSVLGLSPAKRLRDGVPAVAAAFLLAALAAIPFVATPENAQAAGHLLPGLVRPVKVLIAVIGVALVAVGAGAVDRRLEESFTRGRAAFEPIRVIRGEYYAFFLLSIAGAMLLASAADLIWIFLSLELASLPTYVMVAISRGNRRAQEAAVKYFFLGAMAAAMVLYGFALMYGSTGTLSLSGMRVAFSVQIASQQSIDPMALVGVALVILGLAFKITAVPMHFYAPDVYEGAAVHVTAFLSFVPKIAGFTALMVILSTVGWEGHRAPTPDDALPSGLPLSITSLLWMLAVMTMTLGNIGALLQHSVKRMLAYSSIAHSGYMLIGLMAGPRLGGFDAVVFYLLCYGVMNVAVFAGLAAIERRNGDEVDSFDDLSGLRVRHPMVSAMIAAGAASLVGLPPLLGFWGKIDLFVAGINDGQTLLVVIAALNSAVSAFYYLRLAGLPIVGVADRRAESVVSVPSLWPKVAAIVCGFGVMALPIAANALVEAAAVAGAQRSSPMAVTPPAAPKPAPTTTAALPIEAR